MRTFGVMSELYFFDTYALVEIVKGGSNYAKYRDARIVTTIFNLLELHYAILRQYGREIASKVLEKYSDYAISIDLDTIEDANEFRLKNKKKGYSGVDCLGYVISLIKGIKFLTGDKEFEDLPNVEFVK